jgi:quinol-cytochrome oxidoreductase complex cytochrome b subunit
MARQAGVDVDHRRGGVCRLDRDGVTGYLSQTNFDSQWISTQAKDGLNSVAVGAVFNVLNTGQMLLWHIMLLPLIVGVLVVAHVILVRRHGVVPPFDAVPPQPPAAGEAPSVTDVSQPPRAVATVGDSADGSS